MMHPDLAMTLAADRQRELIAEADKHRQLSAARRQARSRNTRRGRTSSRFGLRSGDTLLRWGERAAAPPR